MVVSQVLGSHPSLLDPATRDFVTDPPGLTTARQRNGNRQLYAAIVDALGRSKDAEARNFLDRLSLGATCALGDGLNLMRALEQYSTYGEEHQSVNLRLLGQLKLRDGTPSSLETFATSFEEHRLHAGPACPTVTARGYLEEAVAGFADLELRLQLYRLPAEQKWDVGGAVQMFSDHALTMRAKRARVHDQFFDVGVRNSNVLGLLDQSLPIVVSIEVDFTELFTINERVDPNPDSSVW